jgi:uncharacterized membrane protein YjgN (DUF898 family)
VSENENIEPQGGEAVERFRFTGRAGEYFGIWIVNVCLSLITLGIYSAWAKVRRKRYFYGNTLLQDAAFDYVADPVAILKGRLLVVAVIAMISLLRRYFFTDIFWLVYLVALPYVVIKAARFNAVNSVYRNVRFHFGIGFSPQGRLTRWAIAGYDTTSQFLILPVLLVPLSLGLLYPYYVFRKRQFILQHSAYGATPFSFDGRPGPFYTAYGKAALLFVLFLIGSVLTLGIAALPLYILFASYRDAAVARLSWRHTGLGDLRFDCHWKVWDLFKLHLCNSVAVIFTLGLMSPWATIRVARYELQGISVAPASRVQAFVSASQAPVSAVGSEAGDLLGFDVGL